LNVDVIGSYFVVTTKRFCHS